MDEKTATISFVLKNSQILLAMKKRGFGEGWWNGYGGKVESGEEVEHAAVRETEEEIKIVPTKIAEKGRIDFYIKDENRHIRCHVFVITDYTGEPAETEEMRPQWFYFNEIPFDKMWIADRYWLPYLIEGKKFKAVFEMQDKKTLLTHKIDEVQ